MEIRAYDEKYVLSAQRILGDMMDFAVYAYQLNADRFFEMFLVSPIARQFENGNPVYVAGMTGCELAKEVIRQSGMALPEISEEMYTDKSPEYWSGWALAYYQWYTAKSFSKIHRAVSIQELLLLYPALHEADLMKFVEIMNERLQQFYPDTNLKRIRTFAGLSQNELAILSGIPLRQIQLFEQRQRDINKTQAINLLRLGKALGCHSEDLLEL